jgi:hypothetical protein
MFQRYFIVFPVVILLSTFISSCSTSLITTKEVKGTQNIPPPVWVKSLTYSGYPEDRYIVGRGMAQASGNIIKDQNLADYQAFVEIANQILISIKSDISIEQIEILKNKTSDYREVTTANIFISSSVILRGLKIVDRYYDEREKIYYSLAVLDREIASAPLRKQLNELKDQYEKNLLSSIHFLQQGKIFLSLIQLKKAYESAYNFNELLPYYQLLQPNADSYADKISMLSVTEPLSLASEIISKLSIIKTRGDGQEGIIDKPLLNPLELKVILKDTTEIPAVGLPILFHFNTGNGKLLYEKSMTNNDGLASTTVTLLQKSETEIYSIKATLDFSGLLDTSSIFANWNKLFQVSPPSTLFYIRLKKAPSLKVLLIIDEDNGISSIGVETLSKELTKAGFNPLTEKDIGKINSQRIRQLLKQNDYEKLYSEFLSAFSIIVFGEFNTAYSNQYEGLQIYTVTANIKAISLEKNKVVAHDSFTDIKGFGINVEQARINALQNAGKKIAESLINQILSN